MIGKGGVQTIHGVLFRHVASHAVITAFRPRLPSRLATGRLMAGEAFLSEELSPLRRTRNRVRIVAGTAPETIATRPSAPAVPEPFKVIDHFQLLRYCR